MSIDVARENLGSAAAPAEGETQNVTAAEKEQRLLAVAEKLLDGLSPRRVILLAQEWWQISERTAQTYVQEVQKRFQQDAVEEERLFYLRLSQLQRNRLVSLAFHYLQKEQVDAKALRALTGLMTATVKVLDSRDRTATAIHELLGFKADSKETTKKEIMELRVQQQHLKVEAEKLRQRKPQNPTSPLGDTATGGRRPSRPQGRRSPSPPPGALSSLIALRDKEDPDALEEDPAIRAKMVELRRRDPQGAGRSLWHYFGDAAMAWVQERKQEMAALPKTPSPVPEKSAHASAGHKAAKTPGSTEAAGGIGEASSRGSAAEAVQGLRRLRE